MDYDDTVLSTYLAHHQPYDSPAEVIDTFVRLANSLVGPQVIDGERRELTPDDIEHDMVFENVGGLITNGCDEHLGLCINYRWWDRVDCEAQFVLLLHEITHIEQAGHPPEFWEASLGLYEQAKEQYALVETLFGQPFDWEKADWLFITMADIPNVDFSHECVPERRQRLAAALDYTEEDFDAFRLTTDRIELPEYEHTETVSLDSLNVTLPPDSVIYDSLQTWATREQADVEIDDDEYRYVCEPPTVKPEGDGSYEVVIGQNRVEFLKRTVGQYRESPEVPVTLYDE